MARKRVPTRQTDVRLSGYAAWHQSADRRKVNLSLPVELSRRLGAYAGHVGYDQSDIVARALEVEMRGFVCYLPTDAPSTHAPVASGPSLPQDATAGPPGLKLA